MAPTVADELLAKTQQYWLISQALNSRPNARPISAEDAIDAIHQIQWWTNPSRPIYQFTSNMLEEIIHEEPLTKFEQGAKILTFRK